MFGKFTTMSVLVMLVIPSVLGYGVLVAVKGTNGNLGQGFGVDPSTPRDGTKATPFQVSLWSINFVRLFLFMTSAAISVNHPG